MPAPPERIVCLTDETTETLYRLGEQQRIVGISGFSVRPPEAPREKPRVSAFTHAKPERILELDPDLVVGFSDLQAGIAADLIRSGIPVHIFNQRDLAGIFAMIRMLGAMVGVQGKADTLLAELQAGLTGTAEAGLALPRRPRVYFEEWDDPLISGIRWVSELIGLAGGEDCFGDRAERPEARDRIVTDPREVVRRAPDIIIGSWCGKPFQAERVAQREGWEAIPAVRNGHLYGIASEEILQPGPAALTDGLARLHGIIRGWAFSEGRDRARQTL